MAIDNKKFIKGISIKESADQSKQLEINVNSSANTNTKTILQSSQTANRTVILPDASDTLATVTQVNNHINDSSDAHDASAISNVAAGNLAATDVQSALNELQGDIDTNATNLTNHLNDTADAHDASAVSNIPQGSLASTNVQDALNELQGDITSTSGTVSSHISSTSVHGIVGNVVGDSDSQTLSNKTLSSPVINTPTGLVKGDVGLGNVDNTSDATKNAASAALTNKTIVVANNTITTASSGNLSATELNAALSELQGDIDTRLPKSGGQLSSNLDANNYTITNLTVPANSGDAANKEYVDNLAAGFDPKASVRCATIADISATYATSPSSGRFTSAPSSIDSVSLSVGDRVLVKNQTDAKQNGIYVYDAANQLTRSSDFDGTPAAEVSGGAYVFVVEGGTNSATAFILLGSGTLTLNTNNISFSQIAGAAGNSANNTLSNLSTTSINNNLLPDSTANNRTLGNSSKYFNLAYVTSVIATSLGDGTQTVMDLPNRNLKDTSGSSNFFFDTYPRVSSEKSQISGGASSAPSGVERDLYYNSTDKKYYFHNGTAWTELGSGGGATSTITVLAGENVSANEALYLSQGSADGGRTSGRAYKLDPNSDTRIEFIGFATAAATAGNNVIIQVSGPLAGFSGLSVGLPAYGSVSTPGALQTSAPLVPGQWILNLGVASSATALVVNSNAASSGIKINSGIESTSYALYPNKVTNPNAEYNSTVGYSLYNDAAATPVDLTGGTPAGILNVSASSPISGTNSFVYTPANAVGNGFNYTFTVDQAEKGKVLSITFDYIANSSYVDNDLAVWLYATDGTTGLIQPVNYLIKKSLVSQSMSCTFQSNIDTTTYRVGFHQTTANNSYTFKLDNLMISRNRVTTGSVITDWQSYTPVVTAASGAPTNYTAYGLYSRNGDTLRGQCCLKFTGATAAFAAPNFSIPSGLSIDYSKLVQNEGIGPGHRAGWVGGYNDVGTQEHVLRSSVNNNNTITPRPLITNTSDAGAATDPLGVTNLSDTFPFVPVSGDYMTFEYEVPISGWSSNVVMNNDADTRVIAAKYLLTTNQSVANSSATDIQFNNKVFDTHSSMNTSTYTYIAPTSGYYRFSGNIDYAVNVTGARYFRFVVNGSNGSYLAATPNSSDSVSLSFSQIIQLNAGETVKFQALQTSGGSLNLVSSSNINIERISGPATIAANETIAATYYTTAGQTITSSQAVINFPTKVIDTHGSVSNASSNFTFTAPINGIYETNVMLQGGSLNNNAQASVVISYNGAQVGGHSLYLSSNTFPIFRAAAAYSLLAGQTIRVLGASDVSNITLAAIQSANLITIKRVGN